MLNIELRLKGAAFLDLMKGKIRDKSLLSLAGSVSLLIDSLHPKTGSLSQHKKFTLGLNYLWAPLYHQRKKFREMRIKI